MGSDELQLAMWFSSVLCNTVKTVHNWRKDCKTRKKKKQNSRSEPWAFTVYILCLRRMDAHILIHPLFDNYTMSHCTQSLLIHRPVDQQRVNTQLLTGMSTVEKLSSCANMLRPLSHYGESAIFKEPSCRFCNISNIRIKEERNKVICGDSFHLGILTVLTTRPDVQGSYVVEESCVMFTFCMSLLGSYGFYRSTITWANGHKGLCQNFVMSLFAEVMSFVTEVKSWRMGLTFAECNLEFVINLRYLT